LLAQYKNYRSEKNVRKDSNTETFAALKLKLKTKRWRSVPFFIKVGKKLDKKETSIHLKFRKVDCLLTKSCPSDTNYFTIRIEPDEGFALELNSKLPGKKNEVKPVKMDFCEKCIFGPNTPEAYETLLEDAIRGDQSVFVRNDEIEYSWKIIDSIKKNKIYQYKEGTNGPEELKKWSIKNKIKWKES
jgi:glucose-6-phosphate 1-dehydrogenase